MTSRPSTSPPLGHRDVTYRTRYGTAIATRPGPKAPWWLHLPAAWPRHDRANLPTSRENGMGGFFFRSQAAVARWLEPFIVPEPPGAAPDRRKPPLPDVPTGTRPAQDRGFT